MTLDRVTSEIIFHVRSSSGGTLEWTPSEDAARSVLKAEAAAHPSLWRVNRVAGTSTRVG